jgi:TrmH family RNA methyltransferase
VETLLSAREAAELRALKDRKKRLEYGRFVAEGVRVVEDLLASDLSIRWAVTTSSLEDTPRGAALAAEIDRRDLKRRIVTDREFATLASTETPQGILVVADIPGATAEDIAGRGRSGVVLVLDAVQDPGNFGTLVRSAEAFAALGVVALPGTVDPWNAKSVRSAAGSSFRIPIAQTSWENLRAVLQVHDFMILGATAEGEELRDRHDRVALVVGNEGSGLSREVRSDATQLVAIRTPGRAESLNVAAAAAILLYELSRTRP